MKTFLELGEKFLKQKYLFVVVMQARDLLFGFFNMFV
jgi:hypothetical protein